MNKNMELMKKIIEEKREKGSQKQGKIIPDRYGNQSSGAGKIKTTGYGK